MDKENIRIQLIQSTIERLERRLNLLQQKNNKIGNYRLISFLSGAAAIFIVFIYAGTWAVVTAILLSFAAQAAFSRPHNKIIESIRLHKNYLEIKKNQVYRFFLNWNEIPEAGAETESEPSPIGTDLNLTGHHSLHQLIDQSISTEGSQLLRNWLIDLTPDYGRIIYRQRLIKELTFLTRFRERLLLSAKMASRKVLNGKTLLNWVLTPVNALAIKKIILILSLLSAVNILLVTLRLFPGFPLIWPLSVIIYQAIYFFNIKDIIKSADEAEFIKDELGKFSRVLSFLENYNYGKNKYLKELCGVYLNGHSSPSSELRAIKRITFVLSLRKNPVLWLFVAALIPLDYMLTYMLQRHKLALAKSLPEWLDVFNNLEVLSSIAGFAYLNSDYTFPEILPDEQRSGFSGKELGHPLIPKEQKVTNDFSFDSDTRIVIITGSNMSGKSTFLRTLGINLMLAYSGGPVNAIKMQVSLFRPFTCIKVSDSVIDGISYFYAEVKRLKALLDELHKNDKRPLFFLIDEIFKGTNNVERLIGSRSYIKALIGQNGIGLITTHDLELVKLSDEVSGIHNYHFREETSAGRMVFDFVLRSGPCPTTNALLIMQSEGLPVER